MGLVEALINRVKGRMAMGFLKKAIAAGLGFIAAYLVQANLVTPEQAAAFVSANADIAVAIAGALVAVLIEKKVAKK